MESILCVDIPILPARRLCMVSTRTVKEDIQHSNKRANCILNLFNNIDILSLYKFYYIMVGIREFSHMLKRINF